MNRHELAQERDRVEREIGAWLRKQIANLGFLGSHCLAKQIETGAYREAPEEPPPATMFQPVAMKLRYELLGGHVHVDAFVGARADALALSGHLVMRVPEWQAFEGALMLGAPRVPWCHVVVITEGRKPLP